MEIYIVQPGDTIFSIASKFGVSINKIINENGFDNTYNLVPGQAIIITYPNQTHTVQDGDTISSITNMYGITVMQLLRNNPDLYNREYLYPGETLVISYPTNKKITASGYCFTFINKNVLLKTLPYLSYLSIFNYGVNDEGELIAFGDDTEIIQSSKDYGVAPLLMLSALSQKGEVNIELLYKVLLDEEFNTKLVNNMVLELRSKGYYGMNILISDMNKTNQDLYIKLIQKETNLFRKEGFYFTITINPHIQYMNNQVTFEELDYNALSQLVNDISFLQYTWGTNPGIPSPVSSAFLLNNFIDYVSKLVPTEKIILGEPIIGYDWELPYIPNVTAAHALTLDAALSLARDFGSTIQFDEVSQTPFFQYTVSNIGSPIEHIVWFLDVRSLNALLKIIDQYKLEGCGVWNVMVYYQQMWTLINSQYEINKFLPDNFS